MSDLALIRWATLLVSAVSIALFACCHRPQPPLAHEPEAAAAATVTTSSASPSEEAYTTSALALFRKALPLATIEITERRTILIKTTPSDQGRVVALDRVWHECSISPTSCDETLRHFVEIVVQTVTSEASQPLSDQIMPALRSADYVSYLRAHSQSDPIAEALVADIWVVYFFDEKDRARVVNKNDLAALNLTMDQVREIGRRHIDHRLKIVDEQLASTAPRTIGLIQTGSYYEASRLLQTDVWEKATRTRKEPLLVTIPSSEFLIFSYAEPKDGASLLGGAADAVFAKAGRPISRTVLRWTSKGWQQVSPH